MINKNLLLFLLSCFTVFQIVPSFGADPIAISWSPLNEDNSDKIAKSIFTSPNQSSYITTTSLDRYWVIDPNIDSLKAGILSAFEKMNSEPGDALLYLLINAHGFGNYFIDQDSNPFFHRELVELLHEKMLEFEKNHTHAIKVTIFTNSCHGFSMKQIERIFGRADETTRSEPSRIALEVFSASQAKYVAHGSIFWEQIRFISHLNNNLEAPITIQFSPETLLAHSSVNQYDYYHSQTGATSPAKLRLPLLELISIIQGTHPYLKGYHDQNLAALMLGTAQDLQADQTARLLLDQGLSIQKETAPTHYMGFTAFNLSMIGKIQQLSNIIISLNKLYTKKTHEEIPEEFFSLISSVILNPLLGETLDSALKAQLMLDSTDYSFNNLIHLMDGNFIRIGKNSLNHDSILPSLSERLITRLGQDLSAAYLHLGNQNFAIQVFYHSRDILALPWLKLALGTDYDPRIRKNALIAIQQQRTPQAQNELMALASSQVESEIIRTTAIAGLAYYDSSEVIEMLRALTLDTNEAVKTQAKNVLTFFHL